MAKCAQCGGGGTRSGLQRGDLGYDGGICVRSAVYELHGHQVSAPPCSAHPGQSSRCIGSLPSCTEEISSVDKKARPGGALERPAAVHMYPVAPLASSSRLAFVRSLCLPRRWPAQRLRSLQEFATAHERGPGCGEAAATRPGQHPHTQAVGYDHSQARIRRVSHSARRDVAGPSLLALSELASATSD